MHFLTATALAVLAAQPALATIDFSIGSLTYGNFGHGSQKVDLLVFGIEDSYACDNLAGRLLQNPQGGRGSGNFNCIGCGGGAPKDWDIEKVEINAKDLSVDTKFVTVDKDSNGWFIEDGETGKKLGDCTKHNGVLENCKEGLDVYEVFRWMRCEGVSPMRT